MMHTTKNDEKTKAVTPECHVEANNMLQDAPTYTTTLDNTITPIKVIHKWCLQK